MKLSDLSKDEILRVKSLTNFYNKKWLKEMKGKKFNMWACGQVKVDDSYLETKCAICKRTCYYDPYQESLMSKNHKKLCGYCILEKYGDKMLPEQKAIIKGALKK